MQASYPIESYLGCIRSTFCDFLLDIRYSTELPNIERMRKFLTRIKEQDPTLQGLPPICVKGLPDDWCYIQYNRGPLQWVEEDEFRYKSLRTPTQGQSTFDETRWGYGRYQCNFFLGANTGSAMEICEALYYLRLYKVKHIEYFYQGIHWKSTVDHESLDSFTIYDSDIGFAITWSSTLYVPILAQEREGFTVREIHTDIYNKSDEERSLQTISGYPSETLTTNRETGEYITTIIFDETHDPEVRQEEIERGFTP